jgi:hypothetical protein
LEKVGLRTDACSIHLNIVVAIIYSRSISGGFSIDGEFTDVQREVWDLDIANPQEANTVVILLLIINFFVFSE